MLLFKLCFNDQTVPPKFVSWWEVHKLVDLTTLFELGLKPQGLALEKFLFHG